MKTNKNKIFAIILGIALSAVLAYPVYLISVDIANVLNQVLNDGIKITINADPEPETDRYQNMGETFAKIPDADNLYYSEQTSVVYEIVDGAGPDGKISITTYNAPNGAPYLYNKDTGTMKGTGQ